MPDGVQQLCLPVATGPARPPCVRYIARGCLVKPSFLHTGQSGGRICEHEYGTGTLRHLRALPHPGAPLPLRRNQTMARAPLAIVSSVNATCATAFRRCDALPSPTSSARCWITPGRVAHLVTQHSRNAVPRTVPGPLDHSRPRPECDWGKQAASGALGHRGGRAPARHQAPGSPRPCVDVHLYTAHRRCARVP
jgi:hypothetical protein